ncbi:MAG: sensor histidine kinase [Janthinobacterium lividum]
MLYSPISPASVLLTPRQYLRFAVLTGLAIDLLIMPGLLSLQGMSIDHFVVQLGRALVFTEVIFGLNYYLRYSRTRTQRWLRRQPLQRRRVVYILATKLTGLLLCVLLRAASAVLGYEDSESWLMALVACTMLSGVLLAIQAFIGLTERAQHLVQENEQFKHAQLQARYESLKQQLSPHFLFNSLATLRELIYVDVAAAERFVEEMSNVYRYLLLHSGHNAVPLRDELSFLRSYAYLLQMRFGENLLLHITIPDRVMNRLVPPLALQTLVENVVKHNVIGRQHPLQLHVELREPDYLQVRHVRRPRLNSLPSSGIGLHNLADRVRLLHQAELLVEQDTEFRVSLPLPA